VIFRVGLRNQIKYEKKNLCNKNDFLISSITADVILFLLFACARCHMERWLRNEVPLVNRNAPRPASAGVAAAVQLDRHVAVINFVILFSSLPLLPLPSSFPPLSPCSSCLLIVLNQNDDIVYLGMPLRGTMRLLLCGPLSSALLLLLLQELGLLLRTKFALLGSPLHQMFLPQSLFYRMLLLVISRRSMTTSKRTRERRKESSPQPSAIVVLRLFGFSSSKSLIRLT